MFEIILSKKAQKVYESVDDKIANRFNKAFDELARNPVAMTAMRTILNLRLVFGHFYSHGWNIKDLPSLVTDGFDIF